MSEIRLFTTDARIVRERSALSSPVEYVEVAALDRPPVQLAGSVEEWPPIWIGVAADLSGLAARRAGAETPSRLTVGVNGPETLADPAIDASLSELRGEGWSIDVVVYIGGYGGER